MTGSGGGVSSRAEEAVLVAHAVVTVQRAGVVASVVATVIVALEPLALC